MCRLRGEVGREGREDAHPVLQQRVVEEKAHLGIALDGDADRVIIVDEQGRIVDGDQLMAAIALSWAKRRMLEGDGIETGIDLDELIRVAEWLEQRLGRVLPGQVYRAGASSVA